LPKGSLAIRLKRPGNAVAQASVFRHQGVLTAPLSRPVSPPDPGGPARRHARGISEHRLHRGAGGGVSYCRHVLASRPATADCFLAVAVQAHDAGYREFRPIHDIQLSPTADVAVAELRSLDGLRPLALTRRGEAPTNVDVLTVDHSATQLSVDQEGRRVVRFSPGTLKGNVVRHYVSDFGSTRGMRCFDTSFLALAGASGAPVLLQPSLLVTGMLVVNVERHLHPSKILTVHERGTVTEEVYYHLPFGHALEADEVIAALETLGVSVDAARPSA
jgi:hypothetical protein